MSKTQLGNGRKRVKRGFLIRSYNERGGDVVFRVERFYVKDREEGLGRIMTPVQKDVFIAIDEFWKKYGFGPTVENLSLIHI